MRFATVNDIALSDLVAMARGSLEDTLSDFDFLETLARHRCFLVPPYVLKADKQGQLERVARLTYNEDGQLNKARVLIAIARHLRAKRRLRFGGRLSF
jgi:hypothetical protein